MRQQFVHLSYDEYVVCRHCFCTLSSYSTLQTIDEIEVFVSIPFEMNKGSSRAKATLVLCSCGFLDKRNNWNIEREYFGTLMPLSEFQASEGSYFIFSSFSIYLIIELSEYV
jgi:hypothetical protein